MELSQRSMDIVLNSISEYFSIVLPTDNVSHMFQTDVNRTSSSNTAGGFRAKAGLLFPP